MPLSPGSMSDSSNSHSALRLVIVGAGLIGQRHAAVIETLEHTNLCAIVDTADAGLQFAQSLNIHTYDSLITALEAERPDGVIICTPTTLHVEQAMQCVGAGVPCLIEKPIGTSSLESIELVTVAEERNVPLLVGHHRRHNPLVKAAKQCIADGVIGAVRSVHSHCWFYKPDDYYDIAPWRTQKGAGPISVNLVHDVDLIRHLCGDVVAVQAMAAPSVRGFENEDVASAILTLDNGAIATITVSDSVVSPWSWEMTSQEYPVYPKTSEGCYRIGGSLGALSLPDMAIWTHEGNPDWWSPIDSTRLDYEPADPLTEQMQHFCEVINGKADPLVSGDEGYRSLRVIEAIQQASVTGELIKLD